MLEIDNRRKAAVLASLALLWHSPSVNVWIRRLMNKGMTNDLRTNGSVFYHTQNMAACVLAAAADDITAVRTTTTTTARGGRNLV